MLQAEALNSETASKRLDLVKEVCGYIREDPASKITLADLGRKFGVSPCHLQRTFVDVMGISPRRYLEECRVALLKLRLARGEPVIGALKGGRVFLPQLALQGLEGQVRDDARQLQGRRGREARDVCGRRLEARAPARRDDEPRDLHCQRRRRRRQAG
jgi:AraC-like DNA-binding protein